VRNSDTLTKDLIKYGALQAMRDVVVSDPGPVRRKINKLMNSIFITFKTATKYIYLFFGCRVCLRRGLPFFRLEIYVLIRNAEGSIWK